MINKPFGPKTKESINPHQPSCPACRYPFREGDYTTLVALGPGEDLDSQKKAREGRPYRAIAIEVHLRCATGQFDPDTIGVG